MPSATRPRRASRGLPPWRALIREPSSLAAAPNVAAWLAVLMGPPWGRARRDAARLLDEHDLSELAAIAPAELGGTLGLSEGRAARLFAAFALARALACHRRPARASMRCPRAVYDLLRPRLIGIERETFLALLLDGKHRLRRLVSVSEGTLTSSLVHPREVFRPALREAAAAVIVAHNHPSGDPEPSLEDLEITRRLLDAGRLLGVPLLDHVVVGERDYVSLRERMDFGAA